MEPTGTQTSAYLFVADTIKDEDDQQDAYVAILEERPQTYAEAANIITRLRHTKRNEIRKRPLQLSMEPWTDKISPSALHSAIAQLPASDANLIHAHCISGLTIREIAADTNRGVTAVHEALTLAIRKLKTTISK